MSQIERIVKGASIVFFGMIISKCLTYIYRILIAKTGVDDYGLFSIGFGIFGLCIAISVLGLDMGIVRYVAYYNGKNDPARVKGTITSALKIVLPMSLIVCLLLFAFADTISIVFFNETKLANVLKIFALGIPFSAVGFIFLAVATGFRKVKYEVFVKRIVENIVKVMLAVVAIVFGLGLLGIVFGFTIATIISCFAAFYFVEKRIFQILKTKIVSVKIYRKLLSYSLPLLFTAIFAMIIGWTDTFMIGYLKGVGDVGLYNAALPTAQLMLIISLSVTQLHKPTLSELIAKKQMNEFNKLNRHVLLIVVGLSAVLAIGMVLFSKLIISILFGNDYISALPAFIILILGYFSYNCFLPFANALEVMKKTRFIMLNMMVTCVLNIILNYFLISSLGIVGGAIATSVSLLANGLINGIYFTIKTT